MANSIIIVGGDPPDTPYSAWGWEVHDEKDRLLASSEHPYDSRLKAICGLFGGVLFGSYKEQEFNKLYAEYEATLPRESAIIADPRIPRPE